MFDPGRPLTGVRVADLTMIWAGPYAAKILADQGAEVIKIESPRAWDNIRTLLPPPVAPGEHWWNTNFYFHEYSRNKKSLSLDLASDDGKAIFAKLLGHCDVVIENYRTDVMDNLGLSYEWLREQKEDIIVVGMAGFGKTGPEKDAVGYGPIIEMMSGMTSTSGYGDDGVPYKSGISYGDPIAGVCAAAAVATALIHRQRTGQGQYIDLAQREVMSTLLGEFFMDWSMNQRLPEHIGNGHDWMAPHNVYPCAGEDEWIAICVRTDGEWEGLKRAMGSPEWAERTEFSDQILRWEHRQELDALVGAWTSAMSKLMYSMRCIRNRSRHRRSGRCSKRCESHRSRREASTSRCDIPKWASGRCMAGYGVLTEPVPAFWRRPLSLVSTMPRYWAACWGCPTRSGPRSKRQVSSRRARKACRSPQRCLRRLRCSDDFG